jgi:hypothetical protein
MQSKQCIKGKYFFHALELNTNNNIAITFQNLNVKQRIDKIYYSRVLPHTLFMNRECQTANESFRRPLRSTRQLYV